MKLTLIPLLVAAGMVKGQAGAGFIALGKNLANPNAAFALANNCAVFNNKKYEFGFYGNNRFAGTQIYNGGIAGHLLLNKTALGLNVGYNGTNRYSANWIECNVGEKLNDKITLGLSLGYAQVKQALDYGATGRITGKLAANTVINKQFSAAVVLVNPWLLHDKWMENASQLHAAITYKINQLTQVAAQVKQESNATAIYGLTFKHAHNAFAFLAALQTGNEPISAGITYQKSNLQFVFSSAYHLYLGFTPAFSLLWGIEKR
jgi:hypothetical protein